MCTGRPKSTFIIAALPGESPAGEPHDVRGRNIEFGEEVPVRYSGHDLIRHLNPLQNILLERVRKDGDKYRIAYYDLEVLPYTLGAAWYAVSALARMQVEAAATIPQSDLVPSTVHALADEHRDRMNFMLDLFLDAARRAQNAVIPYLTRGLGRSLPKSMSELAKKMNTGTIQLPDLPHRELLRYWDRHGQRLKDYRDLGQHYALLTSDARVFLASTGQTAIYLRLPANPESKSPAKLRFDDPPVHAYPYAVTELKVLVSHLHWLTAGLLPKGVNARMSIRVFRDPFKLGPNEANVIPYPAHLDKEMLALAEELTARDR